MAMLMAAISSSACSTTTPQVSARWPMAFKTLLQGVMG